MFFQFATVNIVLLGLSIFMEISSNTTALCYWDPLLYDREDE